MVQGIDRVPGKHLGKAAFNVQKKLNEQVNGLAEDKCQEYLERILKVVQQEYRQIYYTESRLHAAQKKQYSNERESLRKEISAELQKVKQYRPQKKYVTRFNGMTRIQLEFAFVKLLQFYQQQYQQSNGEDYEQTLKMMEDVIKAQNNVIIMFTYGLTAAMENDLRCGTYELQKELIKQIGAEIREIEAEITLLKKGVY